MRRAVRRNVVVAVVAVLAMVAAGCQAGVAMWSACSPASNGNPFGTDGAWVLVCRQGRWEPVMTVEEYLRIRRGEHVQRQPLPEPPTTLPPATLDIDNRVTPANGIVLVGFCGDVSEVAAAQSFTAGRTGQLTRIDLVVARSGTPGPLTVQIVNDTPGGPGSTVLGGVTYNGADSPNPSTPVAVELASPAPVVAGQEYVAVLTSAGGCPSPGSWYVWAKSTNPYGGGSRWIRNDGVWTESADWDLSFRTWVRS